MAIIDKSFPEEVALFARAWIEIILKGNFF